jgi:hypothetical protein
MDQRTSRPSDPLTTFLKKAIRRCSDPLVKRWLRDLLEKGEATDSNRLAGPASVRVR